MKFNVTACKLMHMGKNNRFKTLPILNEDQATNIFEVTKTTLWKWL